MKLARTSRFLQRVLLADGAVSGLCGIVMLAGAGTLEAWLGIPAILLRYAGLSLLPFSALVFALARRDSVARPSVLAVIAANTGWVIGSVLLLVSGWIAPTTLGSIFILAQAAAVAAFAEVQFIALRKAVVVSA